MTRGALATAAGILASFWALAAAAVAARAAGAAVGWGVQFQRPGFVAFLAVVVVLFCLNLWGLFEIPLPQRLPAAPGGGAGRPREGIAGHFASGLFATPDGDPLLGPVPRHGDRLRPRPEGAGDLRHLHRPRARHGAPLPAGRGGARRRPLPRPGAWMETVRGVMGFLLAAAAVWLFYVLSSQVAPEQLAAIQLGLLGIALFTWIQHRVASGRRCAGWRGRGWSPRSAIRTG